MPLTLKLLADFDAHVKRLLPRLRITYSFERVDHDSADRLTLHYDAGNAPPMRGYVDLEAEDLGMFLSLQQRVVLSHFKTPSPPAPSAPQATPRSAA